MWLTLLANPKNLAIAILALLLLVMSGTLFYYKTKCGGLQIQVTALTQENVNLKSTVASLNQHNSALQDQVKKNEVIVNDYTSIQKKINALSKNCPKVTTAIAVNTKPPEDTMKIEVKTEETTAKVVEKPSEDAKTSEKSVEKSIESSTEKNEAYVYGGEKFEKDSIILYNSIIDIFNGMRNDKSSSNLSETDSGLSITNSTNSPETGQLQVFSPSGQCDNIFVEHERTG